MGLQYYTQDTSKIPLKYHKRVLFYTKYTHPKLICGGTDGRTAGRTENIYSIFSDKLLLLGEHGQKPMMKKKKYFQVLDLLDTLIQPLRVRQTWPQKISSMIRQMFRHPIFRHIPGKPTLANCHWKSIGMLWFITTQHVQCIQDTTVLRIFQVILMS